MLPHDHFQKVIDPSNQLGILLASHWISVKSIMATITEVEYKCRAMEPEKQEHSEKHDSAQGIGRWLTYLNRLVDVEHRQYNAWPMWVEAQLEQDAGCFGRTIFH